LREACADGVLGAGKRRREVLKALKLTDEQKQKVQAVGKEVGARLFGACNAGCRAAVRFRAATP